MMMYVTYVQNVSPLDSTAQHTQLAWECRTDTSKFFFPPPDFNDKAPIPAMVSCVKLDTVVPNACPRSPSSRQEVCNDGQESRQGQAQRSTILKEDLRSKQIHGTTGDTRFVDGGGQQAGELEPGIRKGQRVHGGNGNGPADCGGVNAYSKQEGRRRKWRGDRRGDARSSERGRNGGRATGRNLMRPFTIDLKEEVRGPFSISGRNSSIPSAAETIAKHEQRAGDTWTNSRRSGWE